MSCFVHFGEVKDSMNGEHCTFLYLKGSSGSAKLSSAGHVLFLCPKTVDFVILGSVDNDVMAAARSILRDVEIGTVVLPPATPEEMWESLGAGHIIQLLYSSEAVVPVTQAEGTASVSDTYAEDGDSVPGMQAEENVPAPERDVAAGVEKDCLNISAAGWGFRIQCCGENAIAMLHGPERRTEAGKALADVFEDCVMNVKVLDEGKRCCHEAEPDGYACALGCVYQEDYDACRFKRTDGSFPYPVGAILLPEAGGELAVGRWRNEAKEELEAVRFAAVSRYDEEELPLAGDGRRYYLIGSSEELNDASVGAACRSGLRQDLVLLKDGEGICCSGMLKYCDG